MNDDDATKEIQAAMLDFETPHEQWHEKIKQLHAKYGEEACWKAVEPLLAKASEHQVKS